MFKYSISTHTCTRLFKREMAEGMGPLIPVPCKCLRQTFRSQARGTWKYGYYNFNRIISKLKQSEA